MPERLAPGAAGVGSERSADRAVTATGPILVDVADGVMTVTMNRPEVHSALNAESHAALSDAFGADFPAHDAMLNSEDAREGTKAFLEKRDPEWQGR